MKVTKHAIDRYKSRISNISNEDAKDKLIEIATKGKVVYERLNAANIMEVEKIINYKGVEILVIKNLKNRSQYIITCLGGTKFRKWYKKEKMQEFRNRKIAI